jgi:hypothetical protein
MIYFVLAYYIANTNACGFLQVKEFLEHFWKGVPLHLTCILGSNAVVNMVGVCDSVLYRSIAGIFVPSTHKVSLLELHNINTAASVVVVQWLACWPLVPKIAGSNPAQAVGFFGRKNPQHAFLRRGSKVVCPMS